jgi:hypothetical protein
MNAGDIEHIRKLLGSLTQPYVKDFIDIEKLVSSSIFSEMTEMALNYAKQHGDLTYMNRMLDLLAPSSHHEKLIDFFSRHTGLKVVNENGALQVQKAALIAVQPTSFSFTLSSAPKTRITTFSDISKPNEISQKETSQLVNESTATSNTDDIFRRELKRLKDAPIEYQASIYAKMQGEKRVRQDVKNREQIQALRATQKNLKGDLRKTPAGSDRAELERKLLACEKAIKKAPKPGRRWSPILPGSFGSGR